MTMFFLYSKEREVSGIIDRLDIPYGPRVPEQDGFDAILQWGAAADPSPSGAIVLNPTRCVLRALHWRTASEVLELNGVKTERSAAGPFIHEFAVPVFHLEALTVFAKRRRSALIVGPGAQATRTDKEARTADRSFELAEYEEISSSQRTFHMRRAVRQAVRGVYALGLDLALVRVAVTAAGRTLVLGVDPSPNCTIRLAELYADAINRYASERSVGGLPQPVMLGADPEFLLRRPDGKVVAASRYMERSGKVGCDAVVLPQHRVILPLAELRPEPAAEPRELVRHLRRTMKLAARLIGDPQIEWLAGSMPAKGLPLGGHIHLSGVKLDSRLLRALDNYLALPLVLIEGTAAGKRRPRYGSLGDFRRKSHGGFEYRSLPSWLSSPALAFAVLALCRVIALHYRELRSEPLQHIDVQRSYYDGDKEKLMPVVRELWLELAKLETYGEYRKELDALRDRMMRLDVWNEQEDFRIAWKIESSMYKTDIAESFML